MAVNVEEMIATTQAGHDVLGNLFWFSVGTQMIKEEDLNNLLIHSGLSEDWMPNKIRAADAFRRATREIQKRKPTSKAGVFQNFLVREVYSSNETVQRNIVVETVDQKDKKLDYETQNGIIRMDKKYGTLSFEASDQEVMELCKEVERKFYLYRDHYSSQHMRVLIPKILGSLAPTPMRRNGTIYFVPHSMSQGLTNLVTFINSLEESEAFKVPVINSKDNKEMVHKKLDDHLEHLLEQCQNTDDLQKGQIKTLVGETNQAIADYKNYKGIISTEQENFEQKILHLRSEVVGILKKS